MLTFALPTGRSLDSCVDILERAGLPTAKLKDAGRNLVIEETSFRYPVSYTHLSFGDRASVDDEVGALGDEGERRNDTERQDVELAHLHGGYSLIEI